MKITRWNIATEGTTDLRDRAQYALESARGWLWHLPLRPFRRIGNYSADSFRIGVSHARRCLALLAAADRIDRYKADTDPCIACGGYDMHDAGCPCIVPSDGLHYRDGQLFNVNNGRPEGL